MPCGSSCRTKVAIEFVSVAQQLLVINKDINGKVRTKEIMPVLFSLLEGPDEPAFRAS